MAQKKSEYKKKKRRENCGTCGRFMQKKVTSNKVFYFICKGHDDPYPHTSKTWIPKSRKC